MRDDQKCLSSGLVTLLFWLAEGIWMGMGKGRGRGGLGATRWNKDNALVLLMCLLLLFLSAAMLAVKGNLTPPTHPKPYTLDPRP